MFLLRIIPVAVVLAIGSQASKIEQRDDCGSGSQQIIQVTFGKTYEVCCPGTSTSDGDQQFCCVGGNQSNQKKREVKRDICFPFCFSSGGDSSSSGCATKVPVTASDYSEQVSSATAALASATASGNVPAQTTGGSGSLPTSSSNGAARGMILEPATFHLLAGGAMAAIANVVAG